MNSICKAVCRLSDPVGGAMIGTSSVAAVGIGFFGGSKIADYFGIRGIQNRTAIEATCTTVALATLSQIPLNCLKSHFALCLPLGSTALWCNSILSGFAASNLGAISSPQYNANKRTKWVVIGTVAAVASSVLLPGIVGSHLALLGSGLIGYTVGQAGMDFETPPRDHFAE